MDNIIQSIIFNLSFYNLQKLNNIKDAVADLTTFTEKKSQERDKTCKLEFDSITKEAAQQDEDEKNDRAAQKAGLADALDARVAGMGKAMNKLVKLQEQLKRHIDNVNSIFQAKYAQVRLINQSFFLFLIFNFFVFYRNIQSEHNTKQVYTFHSLYFFYIFRIRKIWS